MNQHTTIKISPNDFIAIIQTFFYSAIQSKCMTITESDSIHQLAESPIINNEIFGIENKISEELFILHLVMLDDNSRKHRMMSITYKEVVIDMVKNNCTNPLTVAENQWDTLRRLTDKQWDDLVNKKSKSLTLENPSLKI